jgi:cell division protein FtsQ
MNDRINWNMIFKGFAWLVCLAGVVVLMSFITIKKQEVKCENVKIIIPGADNFIEREEIDAILKMGHGQLIGKKLADINIHTIEETLKINPYIAFAKVFVDMDGVLNIEVKQRQPVLRILNAGGQDYYIDSNGLKMPMSPNFTADVLVATGNILEGFSGRVDTLLSPLAVDLYRTALFMKKDTLWDAQIEQLFVTDKQDIELIPRVGNQRIILGSADSLQTKMNNLLAFYKQAMPLVGWNAYKTINLKYINQIVCEKYDSLSIKKAVAEAETNSAKATGATGDTAVQRNIEAEIKKAIATEEPVKEKAKANLPTTVPVKQKPIEKPVVKPVVKTPTGANSGVNATKKIPVATAAPKAKPVATKEKTDTKKNK